MKNLPLILIILTLTFITGCATIKPNTAESNDQTELEFSTFLMFQDGKAIEAMTFYTSLFEGSKVISTKRYGSDNPAMQGKLFQGVCKIKGHLIRFTDSPIKHEFDFTPSTSFFVNCKNVEEINRLAKSLGKDGKVHMPLGDYGFSKRFTWVEDQYGVSWQLNLEHSK